MLYLKGETVSIVILETSNIEQIKAGRPVKTIDGKILIAWTPDPVWLADKIMDSNGDAIEIGKLVDEAAKRPQMPDRPSHPTYHHPFEKV